MWKTSSLQEPWSIKSIKSVGLRWAEVKPGYPQTKMYDYFQNDQNHQDPDQKIYQNMPKFAKALALSGQQE